MKKQAILFIIALLCLSMAVSVIPTAFAMHSAYVRWVTLYRGIIVDYPKNQTMGIRAEDIYKNGHPVYPVVFEVNNTGPDTITIIEVQIPQNATGYAEFYLKDANVSVPEPPYGKPSEPWETEMIEADPAHHYRSVRFKGSLVSGVVRYFNLYFEGGPEQCSYAFTILTHDERGDSHKFTLTLIMDKTPPIIETVPKDGDVVYGTMVPCGDHYFKLNVTAYDGAPHDTGISKVIITIDDPYNPYTYSNESVGVGPGGKWTLPPANSAVWNLANGTHTLNVTVLDGVGNKQTAIIHFTYIQPPGPRISINPTSGHAAPKSWYNPTKNLLESEQKVYKNKVLGTKVTVTGENFEAGAKVTVTVT